MNDPNVTERTTKEETAKIVYIFYLLGIVTGVTGVIGVIMAYLYNEELPEWLASHYRFQIRTFWIGALYLVIGALLSMVVVGVLIILFWAVWLILRSVKGMKALDERRAPPDPDGWWF